MASGLVNMAIDRYINLVDSISGKMILFTNNYYYYVDRDDDIDEKRFIVDPRVNDWPLMDSPFPTLIMVITYLYIVTYLGPKVMANRKPFKLNNVLVLYNAGQVVFSLVMLWEVRFVAKNRVKIRNFSLNELGIMIII